MLSGLRSYSKIGHALILALALTGCTVRIIGDGQSDPALSLSSSTATQHDILSLSPTTKSLAVGNTFAFAAAGGTTPYVYSVVTGGGVSINSSTGSYTAPGTPGTYTIRVTDNEANTVDATVTVNEAVTLSPASITMTAGSNASFSFQAQDGVPSYSYDIPTGPGAVNSTSGSYTPTNSTGLSTVRVLDSLGNAASSSVNNVRIRTNGTVYATVKDGTSWYIGGNFKAVHPYSAPNMIVLNTSGTPVLGCDLQSGFNNTVSASAISGNSLFVGGYFTSYQGQPVNYLAKLNATTCALDTTFSPPASNGFDAQVGKLVISGTSLYVGGSFTAYKGVADSANRLAKLDLTTGTIDTAFSPVGASSNGFNNTVNSLIVSGTSLYAAGSFTDYKGVTNSANFLAKLDLTTGAIDTAFSPVGGTANGFDNFVYALASSGTSLYVAGFFTAYKGVAYSAMSLAKLSLTTGAIDTVFSPVGVNANGFDFIVLTLAVSDTSLYAGGFFSEYKGISNSAKSLAKLDLTTGAIDTTFSPVGASANGFEGVTNSLAVSGGWLYAGGGFDRYRGIANVNYLVRLDAVTGALDTTFHPSGQISGTSGSPYTLLPSGSLLYVGGNFTAYGGLSANGIAKLDATTWELDTTFSPEAANGFNGPVRALQINGTSIYAGGIFTAYRGIADSANYLSKLDLTSGAIDTTFSPVGATANGFNGAIDSLAVNGTSLYVGGSFTAYKGVTNSARRLAKLDLTTGAKDTTFSPTGATSNGFDNTVNALLVNGTSLYVGGDFINYKGVAYSANYLAKLNLTTGAIDTTFSPAGSATSNGFAFKVHALAANGTSLYVGGEFSAYKGVAYSANRLAKLDLTSGAIDTAFSPVGATANGFTSGGAKVYALAVNGTSLYAGGNFTDHQGIANSANYLAKLDLTTGALDTTFSPVGASANGFDYEVLSFAVSGTSLYVGGDLSTYRGAPAYNFVPIELGTGDLED